MSERQLDLGRALYGAGANVGADERLWLSGVDALAMWLGIAGLAATIWSVWAHASAPWFLYAIDLCTLAVLGFGVWRRSSAFNGPDAEARLGAPLFAAAPQLGERALRQLPPDRRTVSDFVLERPDSDYAAAFRGLAHLSTLYANWTSPIIAVTAPRIGDGGAQESLALARTLAVSGKRVVAIDCDVRLRGLTNDARIDPNDGVWEVLDGKLDWRRALVADPRSQACLLGALSGTRDLRPLFEDARFPAMLQEMQDEFDYVVLSCPSALGLAVTPLLIRHATLAVLVVRRERSQTPYVRAALRALSRFNANPGPGIFLTGAPASSALRQMQGAV